MELPRLNGGLFNWDELGGEFVYYDLAESLAYDHSPWMEGADEYGLFSDHLWNY